MIGIKEYNKKITSLKNTHQMTRTMKMVSASKFKRAHKAQANALDYARKLQELMSRLSSAKGQQNHPLIKSKKLVNKVLIVLFTSDKGLCGGFNNNLIRHLRVWLYENQYKYHQIYLSFCGRRGYMTFRKSPNVQKYYEHITLKPKFADALGVAQDLSAAYTQGEFDEIYLAYNRFNAPLSQTPVIEKILPLDAAALVKEARSQNADYAYEPDQNELMDFLIPKFLNFRIYFTFLENAAGEHAARMSAMDKASQNTSDLIDRYTLLRNRARQAAITSELIEIISGAEALK
ncbi:MAG: ATP synthase F1 subunit gamma [Candidatus Omnitrophica bacterium]|nr:ATP synthase F1 subunit gamma [Candidatus Omnitrophota bacterium]